MNWAYASTQREDTSGEIFSKVFVLFHSFRIIILVWLTVPIELFPGHFHIFVGDLSSEVNDATLYACFSAYPSCS